MSASLLTRRFLWQWLASATSDRPFFASIKRNLESDKQFEVVSASREILDGGVRLYLSRQDKNWSLTDCISFVVMEEHGMTEALTSDGHFKQAGFTTLL